MRSSATPGRASEVDMRSGDLEPCSSFPQNRTFRGRDATGARVVLGVGFSGDAGFKQRGNCPRSVARMSPGPSHFLPDGCSGKTTGMSERVSLLGVGGAYFSAVQRIHRDGAATGVQVSSRMGCSWVREI